MHAIADHEFQYPDARYQARTAIAGMWLFLATEALFFGALFLVFIFCRHWAQAGFDAGARHTQLAIGTANTVILLTSSAAYSAGLLRLEANDVRGLQRWLGFALLLGLAFIGLKFGLEWHSDFAAHLFPGRDFAIGGDLRGGAQMFYAFYFLSTALHGVHMLVGIGLVSWILLRAGRGHFSSGDRTPVEAVGLYWSFVDMVWIMLYPLLYLVGRGP